MITDRRPIRVPLCRRSTVHHSRTGSHGAVTATADRGVTAILDHPQVRNLPVGARQARVSSGGRPATLWSEACRRPAPAASDRPRLLADRACCPRGAARHRPRRHRPPVVDPGRCRVVGRRGPRPPRSTLGPIGLATAGPGSSAHQGHQRPPRVGSGARVERGGPPAATGVANRLAPSHRSRRAARLRRSDRRRPRRRHDALGCRGDVGRACAGPCTATTPRSIRPGAGTDLRTARRRRAGGSPASTSARPLSGCRGRPLLRATRRGQRLGTFVDADWSELMRGGGGYWCADFSTRGVRRAPAGLRSTPTTTAATRRSSPPEARLGGLRPDPQPGNSSANTSHAPDSARDVAARR